MKKDERLVSPRFPRSSKYHPDWVIASASGGANALWLTEWLTEALDLRPGMRVLDLGCGRAMSSIFLRREFGVQVWATDLWFSAANNLRRIRDADVEDGVFPIHADARSLPFATEFFDAVVSIDSFVYYGTDDLYLNYLARFLKPGGVLGIAGAGLMQEIEGPFPQHLRAWWEPRCGACIRRRGGVGTGSGPASWRLTSPTLLRTAGKCGETGKRWLRPTTQWRSRPSRRTAVAIWVTCGSWAVVGRRHAWTSRLCPSRVSIRRSPCCEQSVSNEQTFANGLTPEWSRRAAEMPGRTAHSQTSGVERKPFGGAFAVRGSELVVYIAAGFEEISHLRSQEGWSAGSIPIINR